MRDIVQWSIVKPNHNPRSSNYLSTRRTEEKSDLNQQVGQNNKC